LLSFDDEEQRLRKLNFIKDHGLGGCVLGEDRYDHTLLEQVSNFDFKQTRAATVRDFAKLQLESERDGSA